MPDRRSTWIKSYKPAYWFHYRLKMTKKKNKITQYCSNLKDLIFTQSNLPPPLRGTMGGGVATRQMGTPSPSSHQLGIISTFVFSFLPLFPITPHHFHIPFSFLFSIMNFSQFSLLVVPHKFLCFVTFWACGFNPFHLAKNLFPYLFIAKSLKPMVSFSRSSNSLGALSVLTGLPALSVHDN